MTAICGVWHLDGRPGAGEACARMRRALALYGRDHQGGWDGGDIALGRQLARLLPEDLYDRQPLCGGGGRFRLVADLRLDNRPELAAALNIGPERLHLMADADLVLAAWERWEAACIDRLIGDFALAVWDADRRRLLLARDMLGGRPLFYHQGRGWVGFATMAKGLHALPDVPVAPDLETLRDHIALAPHRGSGSYFAGIHRVEPGSMVVIDAENRVETRDWYDWRFAASQPRAPDRDMIEAFRDIFDRAVADRLRASGAIASHLSGGFDSSAVTATAAILLARDGRQLTAYTHVPPPDERVETPPNMIADEGPLAALVAARHPNLDHILVESGDRLIGDTFDESFYYAELPIPNPCNQVWISEICRRMKRRRQTVLLIGAAGNSTISQTGIEQLAQLFAKGRFLRWAREAVGLLRRGQHRPLGILNLSLGPWLSPILYKAIMARAGRRGVTLHDTSSLHPAVLADPAFQQKMAQLNYDGSFQPFKHPREPAEFLLRRNDTISLVRKGQLAAYGVDERDPTADRRLVEFALSLPPDLLMRDGQTKWIYHQAFAARVPAEIRDEPRRGLQAADWVMRLRRSQPLIRESVARSIRGETVSSVIDTEFLSRYADAPLPIRGTSPDEIHTYRLKFLRGASVAHFIGRIEGRN